MNVNLNPDGPHSDDYTREVAAALPECVRVLNRATYPHVGVTWPSTIGSIVGNVHAAAAGLTQLLHQCDARLTEMADTGRLYDDRDNRNADLVSDTCSDVRRALAAADRTAAILAAQLDHARKAASHLGLHDEGTAADHERGDR